MIANIPLATATAGVGSSTTATTNDYAPRLRLAQQRALSGARELIDLLKHRPDEYRQFVSSRPDDETLRRVTTMSDEFGNLTIVFNSSAAASGDSNAAISSSYATALRRRRDRAQRYVCQLTTALLIVVSLFGIHLLFEMKRPPR